MYKLIFNFAIYRVINLFFPIITIPLISHYTNYEIMAELFLLQAYAFWVSLFIDFGFIRTGVVDYLNIKNKQRVVNNIISSQFYIVSVISLILILISLLNNISYEKILFILITGATQGLVPKWLYQAENRMLSLSLRESISKVIALITLIILLPIYNSIETIMISYIIMSVVIIVLVLYDYRTFFIRLKISPYVNVLKTIKSSLYIFKMRLVGNGYLNLNIILLSILSSQETVAIYGICERLAKAMTSVLTSVGEALFPISVNNSSNIRTLVKDLKLSILVSLIPTIIMLSYPNEIISILLSTKVNLAYERIIFLAPAFFSLSSVFSLCYVTSKGKYRIEYFIQIIILILSFLSTIILYFLIGENYPFLAFLFSSFFSFIVYAVYVLLQEKSKCY